MLLDNRKFLSFFHPLNSNRFNLYNWLQNSQDELLTVEILEQSDTQSRQSSSNQFNSIEKTEENSTPMIMKRIPTVNATAASADASSDEEEDEKPTERQQVGAKKNSIQMNNVKHQKGPLPSPIGSAHSFDMQVANWRMEKLEVDSKSGSEEEFYDCLGKR
jgi:membrane-associated phosphatidylinositol transfer protein